jgi:hypothetical protein
LTEGGIAAVITVPKVPGRRRISKTMMLVVGTGWLW